MDAPRWFSHAWWNCGLRLDWAGSIAYPSGRRSRHLARDFWTYIAVTQGRLWVSQGTWRQEMGPREQAILMPGRGYSLTASSGPGTVLKLDFRVFALGDAPDPLARLGLPAKVLAGDTPRWQSAVRGLAAAETSPAKLRDAVLHTRPLAEDLIAAYLADGFADGAIVDTGGSLLPEWLAQARDLIRQQFGQADFSLQTLADYTGFSATHVSHQFRRHLGCSPMAFLAKVRMEIAARLLDTDHATGIAALAERCGYTSHVYFSQVFRRHFGLSPADWRRREGRMSVS